MQKFIFHIAIILFLLTGCGTSSSLNEPATLQFAKHNGKIVFNFGKTETNDQVLARFHDLREEENMTIENKQNEPIVKATKNVNAEQQTEERKDKSNPITNEHNQHNQNQIENRQENSKNKHVVQERNAEKNNQQPIQESRLGQIIIKHLPNTHSEPRVEDPTHIVLHFSSNVVNNTEDPYRINDIYYIFLDYNVSTHYVIDRDGNIYQFVDENRVAWHAGKGVCRD